MSELKIEQSPKRVRAMVAGAWVADGYPHLVWEHPYYPTYYFPSQAVEASVLRATSDTSDFGLAGTGAAFDIAVGDRTVPAAAFQFSDSSIDELTDLTRFDWESIDHWFEEDEEVHVHARSPYHRVDVLNSSRRVTVSVDGERLADSHRPTVLFETGLPTRFYLPKADVRMDLLTATELETGCPYKGTANYWSYGDHKNIAWGYTFPMPESVKIAGLVCFYNEKVDMTIDGTAVPRPVTQFA